MSNRQCNVTREGFRTMARALDVADTFGPGSKVLTKEFSTGSFGWYDNRKVQVRVGDELVWCQVGLTITVIGSKEAKDGSATEAA